MTGAVVRNSVLFRNVRVDEGAQVEDCLLFEVSTPELDDVVRIDDDFGRAGTSDP